MGGGTLAATSNAPMSIVPPTFRGVNPRWSWFRPTLLSPASIAGLPDPRACVKVGPPLSCKAPGSGFWFKMFPFVAAMPHVVSAKGADTRVFPVEVMRGSPLFGQKTRDLKVDRCR